MHAFVRYFVVIKNNRNLNVKFFFLNSTKTYKVWQGGEGGMTAVQTGLVMQMMLVPEKTEFQRFL